MEATTPYQGLFYLSLGFSAFSFLLLGFRIMSNELAQQESQTTEFSDAWHHKEPLEIIEIIEETHDIRSIRFKRMDDKKIPLFSPGQFLSFQIGDNPKLLRSYSISTPSTSHETIQVSVKKLNGGVGSNWFHKLEVGQKVFAYPPSGLFTDDKLGEGERVYIAGGIGITPMVSMILSNIEKVLKCRMSLFYGMRSEQDLAFHDLFHYLSKRYPQFSYYPILSQAPQDWRGDQGHIDLKWIQSKINLTEDTHIFMCGPSGMTTTLEDQLEASGFSLERVHAEKFASPVEFDRESIPQQSVTLSWDGTEHAYSGKQTLLEFFEEKSIPIPYACRVGVCGTCKCKAEGQAHQITDAGLTTYEKRAGMILTCVSFPLSDMQLHSVDTSSDKHQTKPA
ncbi:MAG: iron-sulfur cluster-binding domain-containing protein [Zetaproteobacteria bacterium]|nr:iron-sulfur cluster-binding domain-containing protein [Zetaproteobacteria bacterium]